MSGADYIHNEQDGRVLERLSLSDREGQTLTLSQLPDRAEEVRVIYVDRFHGDYSTILDEQTLSIIDEAGTIQVDDALALLPESWSVTVGDQLCVNYTPGGGRMTSTGGGRPLEPSRRGPRERTEKSATGSKGSG